MTTLTQTPKILIQQIQSTKQNYPNACSIESLIKNSHLHFNYPIQLGDLTLSSEMSSCSNSFRMTHIKRVIRFSKVAKRVKFVDDINPKNPLAEIIDITSIKKYNAIEFCEETNSESCGCLVV